MLKNIRSILLDVLYPRRCPVCDEVLPFGGGDIHRECAGKLRRITGPRCMKCGRQLKEETEVMCRYCTGQIHDFDLGVSAYIYNDAMRYSIYRFKYGNRREYSRYYGAVMAKAIQTKPEIAKAGLIIPVPLYAGKLRERGFNQAELLAAEVSSHLNIPMRKDLVERVRATTAQKKLGAFERRKNLKKAFKIRQNDVELETIIVVDDIFTTGSTIDGIAQILKAAGAEKVFAATLSIGAPK